jgi:hypothetical protein
MNLLIAGNVKLFMTYATGLNLNVVFKDIFNIVLDKFNFKNNNSFTKKKMSQVEFFIKGTIACIVLLRL